MRGELEKFTRLTWPDGTTCVCESSTAAEDIIEDAEVAGPFKLETIYLTMAEFEALRDL